MLSDQRALVLCFILGLSACGGGGSSDDDDFTPLDPGVDYDLAKALFGTAGVSRTESGSGSDTNGITWSYSHTSTTLVSPAPGGPCSPTETQQNTSLTLTETGGLVIVSSGPACYSSNGLIQNTLELDISDDPDTYSLMTVAGDLPLTARIGESGSLGSWNDYEDTNGDLKYDGINGDTFSGSGSGVWRLEDRKGKAVVVLSYVFRDETGIQDGNETVTVFITPSGSISSTERSIFIVGYGTINLSGSYN